MIETKKLNDATLRRITRSDSTTEDVHLTDVPSNVISSGTQITDTVLANINYKDDNTLEFSIANDDVLPSAGKAIFYVNGGKLYCSIDGYTPLEISSLSTTNLIPKKGTTYVSNGALEYFNLESSLKLFSTRTKLGTIPARDEETNSLTDGTYFDFTLNNIKGYISGNERLKIGDSFSVSNSGSSISISSDGDINIKHDNNSKIELDNERFFIKGKSTDIGIDSTKTKFNCHTELHKSSYGNNQYRLQFEDTVKLKNMNNNINLVSLSTNGVMSFNNMNLKDSYSEIKTENSALKISTLRDGLYISNPTFKIQMTGSSVRIRNNVDTNLFEVRSNGKIYIGENELEQLINKRYVENVIVESNGVSRVYMYINPGRLYKIRLVDGIDKIITIKYSDIRTHIPVGDGYTYFVDYSPIEYDDEDDHIYLSIYKETQNQRTQLTIKSLYELIEY
ncbi:MAG: hypothetical protein IJP63_01230 [Acholeplasmatales bacterium]|nr:hypothetical protein [Acholeplasmatales bacterium]